MLAGERNQEDITALVGEYLNEERTANQEREFRRAVSRLIDVHEAPIDDDGEYDALSVVAPVTSPTTGEVRALLRIGALPLGVSGSTIRGWAAKVTAAAERGAELLDG